MREPADHQFGGLAIGQAFEGSGHAVLRVVAIDPDLHFVEAEDLLGVLVVDDIEHFTANHRPALRPLAS
jgi:hypothetical protein